MTRRRLLLPSAALLLFAAALAATDTHGRAKDLAGGEPRSDVRAAVRAAELVEEAAETTQRGAEQVRAEHPGGAGRPDPDAMVAADKAGRIVPSGGSATPEPRDPS